MLKAVLTIIGLSFAFSFLMATVGVWILDKIVIAILNAHKPDIGSNAHLRAWLLEHPELDISQYPHIQ